MQNDCVLSIGHLLGKIDGNYADVQNLRNRTQQEKIL